MSVKFEEVEVSYFQTLQCPKCGLVTKFVPPIKGTQDNTVIAELVEALKAIVTDYDLQGTVVAKGSIDKANDALAKAGAK